MFLLKRLIVIMIVYHNNIPTKRHFQQDAICLVKNISNNIFHISYTFKKNTNEHIRYFIEHTYIPLLINLCSSYA